MISDKVIILTSHSMGSYEIHTSDNRIRESLWSIPLNYFKIHINILFLCRHKRILEFDNVFPKEILKLNLASDRTMWNNFKQLHSLSWVLNFSRSFQIKKLHRNSSFVNKPLTWYSIKRSFEKIPAFFHDYIRYSDNYRCISVPSI